MGAFVTKEERCLEVVERCKAMMWKYESELHDNHKAIAKLDARLKTVSDAERAFVMCDIKRLETANLALLARKNQLVERKTMAEDLEHRVGDTETVRLMLDLVRETLQQVDTDDADALEDEVSQLVSLSTEADIRVDLELADAEARERLASRATLPAAPVHLPENRAWARIPTPQNNG